MELTNQYSRILGQEDKESVSDAVILDEASTPIENRDVTQIAATETDGITINRTKKGILINVK